MGQSHSLRHPAGDTSPGEGDYGGSPSEAAVKEELDEYTLKELKEIAAGNGIAYRKSTTKAALIKIISDSMAGDVNA